MNYFCDNRVRPEDTCIVPTPHRTDPMVEIIICATLSSIYRNKSGNWNRDDRWNFCIDLYISSMQCWCNCIWWFVYAVSNIVSSKVIWRGRGKPNIFCHSVFFLFLFVLAGGVNNTWGAFFVGGRPLAETSCVICLASDACTHMHILCKLMHMHCYACTYAYVYMHMHVHVYAYAYACMQYII